MVCEECHHKEILCYPNDSISFCCPICSNLDILSKDQAIELTDKQTQIFSNAFHEILSKYNKKNLLLFLLEYREKMFGKFIIEDPYFKLDDLLSINVLIKKVMESGSQAGVKKANKDNIKELISIFSTLILIEERKSLINEDFGYFIAKEKLDLETIKYPKILSNFKFVYDEDWIVVIESFDQNLIMTEISGKEYLKKHALDYKRIENDIPKKDDKIPLFFRNPEEIIHDIYPILQTFRVGFTKNKLFAEIFNFDYLQDKKVIIELFDKITKHFHFHFGKLTITSIEYFKLFLASEFEKLDQERLYLDLVFSINNQSIFPLFIELEDIEFDGNKQFLKYDRCIFISMSLINIVRIFYYSFYYNELFNKEIQLLSDNFEKIEVPSCFYNNGFNVRRNIKGNKNSLQIDTIAWNNDILFVVETKIWDVKLLFEHRRVHGYRERDLKGIVDGIKYTKQETKSIPSLITKIDYVKQNINKILSEYHSIDEFPDYETIDYNNIKEIKSLIVTRSYPPIKLYKDVIMIGFNEIQDL
jgi:hypothetical protein